MSEEDLLFTGERFLPSCEREIWYEHYHRYTMVHEWVKGKSVLDAACGEGYGSHLLATAAKSVVGVDLSEAAINHANKTYQQKNLQFKQADVLQLGFPDNSFDVVVSFETLEHITEHEQLIKEFKRVLKSDGVLIISTPDKKEYSDKTGFNNEYHLKELYEHEFRELIAQDFKYSLWYGQKLMFVSAIWKLQEPLKSIQFDCMNEADQVINYPQFNPVYYVVVASNKKLNSKSSTDFFGFNEHKENIYGHYHAVIRAHIKAEKECEQLLTKQQTWLKHPIIGRCIKWFAKD